MRTSTIFSTLLFACSAIGAPSSLKEKRQERLKRLLAERQHLRPLAINYTSIEDTIVIPAQPGHVDYDSNWAGAVIVGTDITSVTGTFTIPTVKEPSGGSSRTEYGASAWVGIDGDTCQSAILQTGVDFLVEGTQTAYQAWYEWYPAVSSEFSNFPVSPGQSIKATVVATSKTAGTATLENLSTGASVTHTFTNEASLGSLCLENAEWIVEDFESGSQLVPFANFGTVTFTGASYTASGSAKGVSGATILDVKQNGNIETSCGTSGSSEVYCTYE